MKKLNKFFAILVALALMATLCVSMAFAADENEDDAEPAAETATTLTETQTSKEALLVKYLDVANGVTAPNKGYSFTWTAQKTDTVAQNVAEAVAPSNVTLTPTSETNFKGDENTRAAVVAVKDLFTANGKLKFTQPGEYKYLVKEDIPTNATDNVVVDGNETWTYDPATYTVRIYVDSKLEITQITVQDNAKTDGEKENATVDPTMKNDETKDTDYRDQGLTFENKYTKTLVDEKSEDGVLAVEKKVEGTYGNKAQKFPFTLTLTAPTDADKTAAIEYTVAGDKKVTTAFENGAKEISGEIADGEKIVFTKLPAGTTYSVTEDLTAESVTNGAKYTPTVTGATQKNDDTDMKGKNLVTVDQDVSDAENATNKVVYTNTFDDSTASPTGILMNNLPYIVLALVAIGGLCAYVIVRRKNADEA